MIGSCFARLAGDRCVQAMADCPSDLSSRYALVGDAVIRGPSSTFLTHEPIEMSSIEPVHCGPAIEPVPYKCGNSLFTCNADQLRHKAVITAAMDRRRKPQHRCPDSACRQRKRRFLRLAGEVGIVCILFGCERALALREQGPGGDDQRAVRARELAAKSFDGTPVRLGSWAIVGEIMDKSCVDYGVSSRCAAAKAFGIFQRTAMYVSSRGDKGFGCRIRASDDPRRSVLVRLRIR
jgi:hypothetical protein